VRSNGRPDPLRSQPSAPPVNVSGCSPIDSENAALSSGGTSLAASRLVFSNKIEFTTSAAKAA
jgi:hypothetical protein